MHRLTLIAFVLLVACGTSESTTADTSPPDTADATVPDTTDTNTTDAPAADADPDVDGPDSDDTTGSADTADTAGTDSNDTEDTADTGSDDISISETVDSDTSSCLDHHEIGDRYSAGDTCNACVCNADGTATCTQRQCGNDRPDCEYDGISRPFAARFPATDGCNECVCAASGLACTRRCPELPEEGAILVESLDTPCGDDTTFTARSVFDELPADDISGPFAYARNGPLYPETLPDTVGRIRVLYEGGFIVCRLPSPTQPAFDIEVLVEWMTDDGSFDEGIHSYLRKNGFGFVDAWLLIGSWRHGQLDGTYDSTCPDPRGYTFSAQIGRDGTVAASASKVCEVDILLDIGTLETTLTAPE